MTRTASPVTVMSTPSPRTFVPVSIVQSGLARMLCIFCSVGRAQNHRAPSCQAPATGVTWGVAGGRTVVSQYNWAPSSRVRVASQSSGSAPGWL
uniref:SibB n=1 Tax=Streptosporangium sibiricum TaxID=457432 RepID=C0LTL6_STRSJ|nr:SibB [Streptosporangium sibiricum]